MPEKDGPRRDFISRGLFPNSALNIALGTTLRSDSRRLRRSERVPRSTAFHAASGAAPTNCRACNTDIGSPNANPCA